MIRHLYPTSLLGPIFTAFCLVTQVQAADPIPAPAAIFDGQSLAGWTGNAKAWRVEDGALTAEIPDGQTLGQNEPLAWSGEVGDFDLTGEFRISGAAHAGIVYRSHKGGDNATIGYEAGLDDGKTTLGQIAEQPGRGLLVAPALRASVAPDGRRWKDALTDPVNPATAYHTGDWNSLHVVAHASHVEVWINGTLFSALDDHQADASAFSGGLALQLDAGAGAAKVQFRKLQLTTLGKTAKPAYPGIVMVAQGGERTGIRPVGADGKPLNLDFETGTLADWKAEGNAFEGQPVEGDTTSARDRGPSRHQGKFWIGTYEKAGDPPTGTLTSASFVVNHPWGSFLVAGGSDAKTERVEIVDEESGKVVAERSGEDHENLKPVAVDLKAEMGKKVFIRLVDQASGGWGHINFDDFLLHDNFPAGVDQAATPAVAGGNERLNHQKESPVLWQLLPNPAKPTDVANAEAQSVMAGMKLTSGFQAELIAAEPDVRQPIAFCFDERGRLWVAEAYSYPNKQPEGKGQDRILIFDDPDGNGGFKSRKVFMEGLNLVSGLEVGFGGVWVGAAPQLIFIPKDADDHAGKPEILLDGFGYQDTHETLNSFTWGPDGWLYGNQGVFNHAMVGAPGTPDGKRTEMRSAVWRFHPIRHEFEIFADGGSNQWGLDYNSAGHLFMTHCRSFWGGGGTTFVIRNGQYWNQANGFYAQYISASAPDFAPALKNYLPAAAKYDSGAGGAGKPGTDAVYGGHSHVGTMIYQGDNWPLIYRDHLFTNNLFGHQMNQQELVREGSAYEAIHAGYDLLMAPDPKYMSVNLKTGPDGAVYLIDWCDLQHCHNPDPTKWDRTNGRIYRVSWAASYHPLKVDLGAKSDVELAQLTTHANDWFPRMARHLLQERATKGPIDPQAIALLRHQSEKADATLAVKAVLTLHVIGALDAPQLARVAKSDSEVLREWAVQLATEKHDAPLLDQAVLVNMANSDPSAAVRLALASAMPALPLDATWQIGESLAAHTEDAGDRFLPKMIWFGLARGAAADPARALAVAQKTPMPSLADSVHWFVSLHQAGREQFVAQIAGEPKEAAAHDIRLLAFAMKDEAGAPRPAKWSDVVANVAASSPDPQLQNTTDELSALFGDKDVLAKTRAVLADASKPLPVRQQAFALLRRVNDADALPVFAQLLDIPDFRSAVLPMLGRSNNPATATAILQRFEGLKGPDRAAALNALTSRPELAIPLLEAIKAGNFSRQNLTAVQIRQLGNLKNDQVNKILDETWGHVGDTSEAAKATMAKFKKAYQAAPMWAFDAKAGQATFTQVCTVCHSMNGVGGTLGPDLGGSWRNGLDYFLENIIDPNAVVGENYQLHVITKKDGSVVSGLLDKETDTAITMRTLGDPVIVAKIDIQEHQKLAQSLMPPGLLESMPENKVLELLKFLTSKPDKE